MNRSKQIRERIGRGFKSLPGALRRARGYSTPMLTAIGNTPLVRLSRIVPQGAADVWVKLEYYNPTGSYKERMAASLVERAEQRCTRKLGMEVGEYSCVANGTSRASA